MDTCLILVKPMRIDDVFQLEQVENNVFLVIASSQWNSIELPGYCLVPPNRVMSGSRQTKKRKQPVAGFAFCSSKGCMGITPNCDQLTFESTHPQKLPTYVNYLVI
ncbi:hypothetical protein [Levilinea saccharolytica]|uniref:hypothetical protein n=1 Tax=Levilinea saccharolytica TaxID=229921 RepID=UPI001364B736|nr:hypothetical protein [Levilinea saccharolytica]